MRKTSKPRQETKTNILFTDGAAFPLSPWLTAALMPVAEATVVLGSEPRA